LTFTFHDAILHSFAPLRVIALAFVSGTGAASWTELKLLALGVPLSDSPSLEPVGLCILRTDTTMLKYRLLCSYIIES